uniref:Transcription elongation factor SPT6 n=1 Tax=Petromyzon marinus TaxID=7757 RepID=A0AAJ7WJS1_PETMA
CLSLCVSLSRTTQVGMMVHCRVMRVDVEKLTSDLTTRSSDLADSVGEWRPRRDDYYDTEHEERVTQAEERARQHTQRAMYVKRVIVHPSFHNINYKEAEALMATLDQGEAVIRPSSKGTDHLTVTWKVAEGVSQHLDVREERKENPFSLGHSLWINGEEFEDLDEIIARHVQPMASLARDLLSHKYYRESTGGDTRRCVEELLAKAKRDRPSQIPYLISASTEFPGKFLLGYQPRNKPWVEFVTVTPDGFRYRGQIFPSVNALFRWFKEHFRDPIPGVTPGSGSTRRTPSSVSATPANINFSGEDQFTHHSLTTHSPLTHTLIHSLIHS